MAAVAYYRQGLTGGGATDLDEIDGAILNDGDFAFVMTGTTIYHYRLDSSSGATPASPNIIAPVDSPSNNRWLLQSVQNIQSLAYSDITSNTTLTVGSTYNDSAGTNTHTLPLLSTTSAGEKIELYISGTDRTAIINHNGSDSSGAEIWTGYAIGDHVTLVSNGTAWMVKDEASSVSGHLALSADDSVSANSKEKIFDTNYSEVSDIGGWWSTGTNKLTAAYDCLLSVNVILLGSSGMELRKNGSLTAIVEGDANNSPNDMTYQLTLYSGNTIEIYCNNTVGSTVTVRGDAALDESQAWWHVKKRIR